MSAITEAAPTCRNCGGRVELEVDFGLPGNGPIKLFARCTDCDRRGYTTR